MTKILQFSPTIFFLILSSFYEVIICICYENISDIGFDWNIHECYQRDVYSTLYITAEHFHNTSLWENVLTEIDIPQVSIECYESLATFSLQTNDPYNSLTYLLDSFSKPPKGLLEGNFKWLGDWDECKQLNNTNYVRIVIPIVPLLGYTVSFVGLSLAPDIGICLPAACSNEEDTLSIFNYALSIIQPYVPVILPDIFNTSTFNVITEQIDSLDSVSYLSIIVIALFVVFVTIATIVHLLGIFVAKLVSFRENSVVPSDYPNFISESEFNVQASEHKEIAPIVNSTHKSSKSSKLRAGSINLFKCFSLYSNIKLLFASHSHSSHSIDCLSGIRSLSMLWVLMCHSYLWLLLTGAVADVENILLNYMPLFSFTIAWNGFASLDTLFAISGCLAIFHSFKQLEKNNYLTYILKYYGYHVMRIAPTYLILVLIMWGLTPYIGSGPMWSSAARKIIGNCGDNWWTNFFFINTFYPTNLVDSCISWSWYIAIEMQFLFLSPLFIIPAHYFRVYFSLILPIGVFLISTGSNLFVLFFNDINSYTYYLINNYLELFNISVLLDNAQSMEEAMANQYYTKFYLRISSYLAGMVVGYFLYKIPIWRQVCADKRMFDRILSVICVLTLPISVALLIVLIFTPNWLLHGMPIVQGLVYTLLSVVKNLWGIGIALLIFNLTLGFGGPLRDLLTWKAWAPLSRLTFVVYLIHPIVMTVFFLTLRRTLNYDTISFSFIIAGLMVVSYGVASVFTLLIYLPIKNLLKLF